MTLVGCIGCPVRLRRSIPRIILTSCLSVGVAPVLSFSCRSASVLEEWFPDPRIILIAEAGLLIRVPWNKDVFPVLHSLKETPARPAAQFEGPFGPRSAHGPEHQVPGLFEAGRYSSGPVGSRLHDNPLLTGSSYAFGTSLLPTLSPRQRRNSAGMASDGPADSMASISSTGRPPKAVTASSTSHAAGTSTARAASHSTADLKLTAGWLSLSEYVVTHPRIHSTSASHRSWKRARTAAAQAASAQKRLGNSPVTVSATAAGDPNNPSRLALARSLTPASIGSAGAWVQASDSPSPVGAQYGRSSTGSNRLRDAAEASPGSDTVPTPAGGADGTGQVEPTRGAQLPPAAQLDHGSLAKFGPMATVMQPMHMSAQAANDLSHRIAGTTHSGLRMRSGAASKQEAAVSQGAHQAGGRSPREVASPQEDGSLSRADRASSRTGTATPAQLPDVADWPLNPNWQELIRPILLYFTERTPGSFVEFRDHSVAWHFLDADLDLGSWQAKDMQVHLEATLATEPLCVKRYRTRVEIRPPETQRVSGVLQVLDLFAAAASATSTPATPAAGTPLPRTASSSPSVGTADVADMAATALGQDFDFVMCIGTTEDDPVFSLLRDIRKSVGVVRSSQRRSRNRTKRHGKSTLGTSVVSGSGHGFGRNVTPAIGTGHRSGSSAGGETAGSLEDISISGGLESASGAPAWGIRDVPPTASSVSDDEASLGDAPIPSAVSIHSADAAGLNRVRAIDPRRPAIPTLAEDPQPSSPTRSADQGWEGQGDLTGNISLRGTSAGAIATASAPAEGSTEEASRGFRLPVVAAGTGGVKGWTDRADRWPIADDVRVFSVVVGPRQSKAQHTLASKSAVRSLLHILAQLSAASAERWRAVCAQRLQEEAVKDIPVEVGGGGARRGKHAAALLESSAVVLRERQRREAKHDA